MRRWRAALAADGVRVAPYDDVAGALAALPADGAAARRSAPDDARPGRAAAGRRAIEAINPSTLAKSRKSDAEAANVRRAMVEDGAAMCEFYAWFEAALADPARRTPITELTIDEKLAEARARRAGLRRAELRDDRRLQRQRRDAALPGDAGIARDDRRRRPAADRLGRAVPRRHHRHHAHVADRPHQRGAAARRDDRPARHDGAEPHALPARHARADARRDRARAALGSTASTTATAPATASAISSTSTRGRRRSRAPSPSRRWRCSRG